MRIDDAALDFSDALTNAHRQQQAGNLVAAESSYRQLVGRKPDDPWVIFLLSTLTLQRGDVVETLQLLGQLLAGARAEPDILRGVGDMYKALGRSREALQAYGQGLQRATECGAMEATVAFMQRIINNEHADAGTLIGVGKACEAQGRNVEAVAAYERALQLLRQNGAEDGQFVGLAERILGFEHVDASTLTVVGSALDAAGKPDQAIAAHLRAIQSDAAAVEAYRQLATPMVEAGRAEELAELYDRALRQHPAMHLDHADGFLAEQRAGIDRGIPGVCIFTMPKTGTEFINARLCTALNVPRSRLSLHLFPDDIVIPSWSERVARGGTVCVEHVDANPRNLDRLVTNGIVKVVLHVRDPRQATLSWVHHVETLTGDRAHFRRRLSPPLPSTYGTWDFSAKLAWHLKHHLPQLVRWTGDWVQAAAQRDAGTEILFTRYEDFRQDDAAYFNRILDFYGISRGAFHDVMPTVAKENLHFRKGEVDEWVRVFSDEQREMAERAIPPQLARRFGWRH